MYLVLPGGGIHFPTLAGAAAVLARQRRIEGVGGTSAGGLVACAVAARVDLEEAVRLAVPLSKHLSRRWTPWRWPPSLYDGRPVRRLLRRIFGDIKLGEVLCDLCVVSADVQHQRQVILSSQDPEFFDMPVWAAAYATMAVPVLLPPLEYRGMVLVDGGITSNLAVDDMPFPGDILALSLERPVAPRRLRDVRSYLGAVLDTAIRENESEDGSRAFSKLVLPRSGSSLDLESLTEQQAIDQYRLGQEYAARWVIRNPGP